MLRVILLITLIFFDLYACKGGYDSCKRKIIDSHTIKNTMLQIPIQYSKRLIFSHTTPNGKIIKYDHVDPLKPFSNINLPVRACKDCNYQKSSFDVLKWCEFKGYKPAKIIYQIIKKQKRDKLKKIFKKKKYHAL